MNNMLSYTPGCHHALGLEDPVAAPGAALAALRPLLLVRHRGVEVDQGPGLLVLTRPGDVTIMIMMMMS